VWRAECDALSVSFAMGTQAHGVSNGVSNHTLRKVEFMSAAISGGLKLAALAVSTSSKVMA
jgi:hypothetical protein